MSQQESNAAIERLREKGKVEILPNHELTRLTGVEWKNLFLNGAFYCNVVEGILALGTAVVAA